MIPVRAWIPALLVAAFSTPSLALPFFFSTGGPDGRMAMASRPDSAGKIEIETADDFIANASTTTITSASFTGLLAGGAAISDIGTVTVELYRVFPLDSANPPSGNVPTRANSPSDVAVASRSNADSNLTFTCTQIATDFTAANSVLNGINKKPNQNTDGEGPVSGAEVTCDVAFTTPFSLPADHYFFVPQVSLGNGEFYWLSAPRPITGGSGPFVGDLQTWIRNANLDPDWLRVGTDIVGGATPPTFNAAFSLTGDAVPEPATDLLLLMAAGAAVPFFRCRVSARRA